MNNFIGFTNRQFNSLKSKTSFWLRLTFFYLLYYSLRSSPLRRLVLSCKESSIGDGDAVIKIRLQTIKFMPDKSDSAYKMIFYSFTLFFDFQSLNQ